MLCSRYNIVRLFALKIHEKLIKLQKGIGKYHIIPTKTYDQTVTYQMAIRYVIQYWTESNMYVKIQCLYTKTIHHITYILIFHFEYQYRIKYIAMNYWQNGQTIQYYLFQIILKCNKNHIYIHHITIIFDVS